MSLRPKEATVNEHAQNGHRQGRILSDEGRRDEAARCYNLGNALYMQGKLDAAVASYQRALDLRPDDAAAHNNLGAALTGLGRLNDAVASYQRALKCKPDNAEAHNNLGNVFRLQGKLDEAVACMRTALQLKPDYGIAHYNLGNSLRDQGLLEQAVVSYERALQFQPNHGDAYNNLGAVHLKLGRREAAMACCRRALQLNPANAEAHNNLGNALQEQGNLDEALACFQSAQQLKPEFVEAHFNLGNALRERGDLAQAALAYQSALRLNPRFTFASYNLGNTLWELGKLPDAIERFSAVIEQQPNHADAHFNRGLVWLLMGHYSKGWPEYEWRWQTSILQMPKIAQPLWDGSPLAGRTIYLHAEQGLGDTFQFIRYVRLLKEQRCRTIVACQQSLVPVLGSCAGIDQLVSPDRALPSFDVHAPLLSLPGLCGTTLDNIPAQAPYLHAAADLQAEWKNKLSGDARLKVGLCWQGNPKNKEDRVRSIQLERLAPLAQIRGVRLFSLQKGIGVEQLEAFRESWGIAELGLPWAETAAVISALDIVVTVDSAIAHLAGALGKTAWVLLPFVPNWRWLTGRTDSPWYPTIRLFRQQKRGEWGPVIQEVAETLGQRVAGN